MLGSLHLSFCVFVTWILLAISAWAQDASADNKKVPSLSSDFQHQLGANGVSLKLPPQGKAILVNIPAFELIAFEDAEPVFRSRVIVGTPWHRTPRLETYTSVVRIRPTWRPTPSMVASGEYKDRTWPPGLKNPLGLAAIRLEPGLLVYLHDTNRRELFSQEKRALSHGCVRVQRWDELVAWVLDFPIDQVHKLANGTKTLDLPTKPIPVQLGYYLRFPDEAGGIVVHEDVYGLGRRVASPSTDNFTVQQAGTCTLLNAG